MVEMLELMVNRAFKEHKAVALLEEVQMITDYPQYKVGKEEHLTLVVKE